MAKDKHREKNSSDDASKKFVMTLTLKTNPAYIFITRESVIWFLNFFLRGKHAVSDEPLAGGEFKRKYRVYLTDSCRWILF